jgi:hypothetical protein
MHVTRLCVQGQRLIAASSVRGQRLDQQYLRKEELRYVLSSWDGRRWETLREGTGGLISSLIADGDRLYVGFSLRDSSEAVPAVLTCDGRSWRSLGVDLASERPGGRGSVEALCLHQGTLVAGGSFDICSGYRCRNLAFWDGRMWWPLARLPEDLRVKVLLSSGPSLWCGGFLLGAAGASGVSLARCDGPLLGAPSQLSFAAPPGEEKPSGLRPDRPPRPPFRNGDFSQWEQGAPVGWEYPFSALGGPLARGDRKTLTAFVSPLDGGGLVLHAASGPVEAPPPRPHPLRPAIIQEFAILPGRTYAVRAEARLTGLSFADPQASGGMTFYLGSAWESLPIKSSKFAWYELTLLAPERAVSGKVTFGIPGGGSRLEIRQVLLQEREVGLGDSFELLVQQMADRYAHFHLCASYWDSLVEHYRPLAHGATSREALLNMLTEMLSRLKDRRILLQTASADVIAQYVTVPPWQHRARLSSDRSDRQAILAQLVDYRDSGSWGVGHTGDGISYCDLRFPWRKKASPQERDLITDLLSAEAVILDLRRFSSRLGRFDPEDLKEQALLFASRFADREVQYGWEQEGSSEAAVDTTSCKKLILAPTVVSSRALPLVCLINGYCEGIATELAMMFKALPNATLVGQPTAGTTQKTSRFRLPCGLSVTIPTSRYFLPAGREIDDRLGVEPDIPVDPDGAGDPTFQAGLGLLRERLAEGQKP